MRSSQKLHYDMLVERFDETNIDEIATILMLQKEPVTA